MSRIIKCKKCGEVKELWGRGMCHNCCNKEFHEKNPEYDKEYRRKHGGKSMEENKDCALFLGVHVAERVLSKVFKDVKRMRNGNKGFDFKCNKGKKIDVKSSTLKYRKNSLKYWIFTINKNTTADYFLCLAFDNRKDLNPMHIWLIPGEVLNHLSSATISKSTIPKWKKYEKDVSEVVNCCDTMKK